MRRRLVPRLPARPPAPRRGRRDRHARGLRGPLAPPEVPLATTKADRFDELVLDAVEDVARRRPEAVQGVDFAVEDVPLLDEWAHDWVPLARSWPAGGEQPARVVVYRRPVEGRATDARELRELVHDVVVEELAELLGVEPEEIDPEHGT